MHKGGPATGRPGAGSLPLPGFRQPQQQAG